MSDSEVSPKKRKSFLSRITHSFRKKCINLTDGDNENGHNSKKNESYKENTSQEASPSKNEKTTNFSDDENQYSTNNIIDNESNKQTLKVSNQIAVTPKLDCKFDAGLLQKNRGKTRKFISKEIKNNDDSSSDSDYSTTDTSDSSDENERFLDYEKGDYYLKSDYFTKGKYMTYFFLQMEKMNYNPYEVYSIIQYHDSENLGERGEKDNFIHINK